MSSESKAQILQRMNQSGILKRPQFSTGPSPTAGLFGKQFSPNKDSLSINVPMQIQVWLEPTFENATTDFLYKTMELIARILAKRPDAKR